jgi:hypothetical protein
MALEIAMSDAGKDGGPAFPVGYSNEADGPTVMPSKGMSLRDHFAIQALPAVYADAMKEAREGSGLFQHDDWRYGLALDAYDMADAMLKARGRP